MEAPPTPSDEVKEGNKPLEGADSTPVGTSLGGTVLGGTVLGGTVLGGGGMPTLAPKKNKKKKAPKSDSSADQKSDNQEGTKPPVRKQPPKKSNSTKKHTSSKSGDSDEDYSSDDAEEGEEDYRKGMTLYRLKINCEFVGGYHRVHIGDNFKGGKYKVTKKLGWGHFSTVWLANDTRLDHLFAHCLLTPF